MIDMMTELVPDFVPGPLDFYRKKASFDWKKLKIFIDTEEGIRYENDLHHFLKTHPDFQQDLCTPSLDQQRHITARRTNAMHNMPKTLFTTKRIPILIRSLMQTDASACGKYFININLFQGVLRSQGTERHAEFLQQLESDNIFGCFCMTEIGHGSNINSMRTTATFNQETQQFILHTPDFEAVKCLIGNLSQMASVAVVCAQLYLHGECYGMHMFVVPIRDPTTLIPYPGVIVGDMGEKIGLQGVDNGFLIFDQYPIPRENLLNKNSDVTPLGEYKVGESDPKIRLGVSLGALSIARVLVTVANESLGTKALIIAIRYAAVRKQFGLGDCSEEVPILEYQSHQCRLLPYLAASYITRIFNLDLTDKIYQFTDASTSDQNPDLGFEFHVLSSAYKSVSGWLFRDAIQESREACGGHGYLKAAGIGSLRNDQDSKCTYEGENHVLIQQTSNWLTKLWPKIEAKKTISTPMKSADFLSNGLEILNCTFQASNIDDVILPVTIINCYQWLTCYFLRETKKKFDEEIQRNCGKFWAKNNTQVYYAKNLGIVFIQHFLLQTFLDVVQNCPDTNIRIVLSKLFSLYGLWSLEKFLIAMYEGGYTQGPQAAHLMHEAILKLCEELKDDAVALVDAVAPPDFILNSVLGASDGLVYKHLQSAIFGNPSCMRRPYWWKEIVNWKNKL